MGLFKKPVRGVDPDEMLARLEAGEQKAAEAIAARERTIRGPLRDRLSPAKNPAAERAVRKEGAVARFIAGKMPSVHQAMQRLRRG